MIPITTEQELAEVLSESGKRFYVYVLYRPHANKGLDTPFYVGIGQGNRLFAHEREARDPNAAGSKLEVIRGLWAKGLDIVRIIDSFHDREPWDREEALINQWGLLKDGTGLLVNEQRYARACTAEGGAELRKYAHHGNELPPNFRSRCRRLRSGPRRPANPDSVYGKICAVLDENPGTVGAELVELLLRVDFSANKSAYTKSGEVSRPWLAGYIDGGFYKRNQCIQEF